MKVWDRLIFDLIQSWAKKAAYKNSVSKFCQAGIRKEKNKDFPKSLPKMSASEQMRAMLDQLMGTSRNGEFILLFSCRFPDFFSFHFVYLKWRNFLQSPRRKQAKQLKTQWGKVWLLFCALLWLQFQHPLSFLGLISADPSFSVEKVSSLSLMCKSSAM